MLEEISARLTPENTRQILLVLRVCLFVALFAEIVRISFYRIRGPRHREYRIRLVLLLVVAAFLGIYVYQANWQLIGFLNPDFVRIMELYNPRPENPASLLVRGRILDNAGRELAVSAPDVRGFRRYPEGAATAHIVGYRNPIYGKMGMERAADSVICGYIFDPHSKDDLARINQTVLQKRRMVGSNVMLTLDADLQHAALDLFTERGYLGAAVAIDPRDGSLRLLSTAPSFDPNDFQQSLNKDASRPLVNRAIQGLYPPGSTFKLAIAALAFETGNAVTLDCPAEGYFAPGARKAIHDHEWYENPSWGGFGKLDIRTAFAKSSNTYFARAGVLSGTEAFNALAEGLRINESVVLFESPTGNRLAASKGSVPVLGSGKAALRELSQLSIGQGKLLVTPLHIAMLGAAIANDGVLYRPRLDEHEEPKVLSNPIRASTAARVRDLMREAVMSGTGRKADIPGLEVGGKTGTAQNPHGKSHGWFVCMAPVSAPKLVVAVIVENQGYGSQTALPIAAEILKKARDLGYFE